MFEGPRLPLLTKAASAADPADVANPAACAAGMAACRLLSDGSPSHFSAASSALLTGGGRVAPAAARTDRQVHQTASGFGRAWARNRIAAGHCFFSISTSRY